MPQHLIDQAAGIAAAVIGLAIIAVIVSQHSETSNIITSAGKSFASLIGAAVKPATS